MKITVEIWSDIVCPWCYIGKRRFESALKQFEHRDKVQVQWRSFELYPDIPKGHVTPALNFFVTHKNVTEVQARNLFQEITKTAAKEGLTFNYDKALRGSTFDGHRLIHLANQSGKGDQMKERLLTAYFERGESLADITSLVNMAAEVGLDAEAARTMLDSNALSDAVKKDEANAKKLGISGVPFFLINGKYQISGAQSPETILKILQKAAAET